MVNELSPSTPIAENSASIKVGLEFNGDALATVSEMRSLGGYKDFGEMLQSAIALKRLIDESHREGYSILIMQNHAGKQRRMNYEP